VTGYTKELVYDHDHTEDVAGGEYKPDKGSEVQFADISPSGLLGWLTGKRHCPLDGEKLLISVKFDHECLQKNPCHTLCFPIVAASARNLTLPLVQMQEDEEFKRIMLLALQAFAVT